MTGEPLFLGLVGELGVVPTRFDWLSFDDRGLEIDFREFELVVESFRVGVRDFVESSKTDIQQITGRFEKKQRRGPRHI